MRKISIRFKILFVILSVLSATVIVYLFFAVKIFNKDKITYIYDSNAMLSETLADQTDSLISSIVKSMNLLDAASNNNNLMLSIFNKDQDIVEYYIYEPKTKAIRNNLVKPGYLEMYNLDNKYLNNIREEKPIPFDLVSKDKIFLQNSSLQDGAPVLTVATEVNSNKILVANIRQDHFLKIFSKSQMYKVILVDKYGKILSHSDTKVVLRGDQLKDIHLLKKASSNNIKTAVNEYYNDENELVIGSFSKTEFANLFVISEIPKKMALTAAFYLVNKSILFAILLISIGFIVSFIFSKTITNPIRKIFNATKEVSNGNFKVKVDIKSEDEIGVLSDSFNKMTSEIERLMEETKDKIRMEKEFEVAKAVQDTLFPKDEFKSSAIELALYYKPATECGGDWCDYIETDNSIIVLIGDATGHGVPAALLTASAHSCCSVLQELAKNNINILTPAKILNYLNVSIFKAAAGKLLMTFFVGLVDKKTGMLTYSNASHNPPLICNKDKEVTPLMDAIGARLGENSKNLYSEASYKLNSGDMFMLYTDGVTELKNSKGEQWGNRRFIKSTTNNILSPLKEIKAQVLNNMQTFAQNNPLEDDITFILGKYN